MGCGVDSIPLQFHDGGLWKNSWGGFGTSSDRKHRTDTYLLNHNQPYPKHTRHKAAIAGIAEILIHVKS